MKIITNDRSRSKVFTASYPSSCKKCGKEIRKGQKVRYYQDRIQHESCHQSDTEAHLVMQTPRRKVNTSFIAEFSGTCPRCYQEIRPGDRVRYSPDNELVHHTHSHQEKQEEICSGCWLVKPCECS